MNFRTKLARVLVRGKLFQPDLKKRSSLVQNFVNYGLKVLNDWAQVEKCLVGTKTYLSKAPVTKKKFCNYHTSEIQKGIIS